MIKISIRDKIIEFLFNNRKKYDTGNMVSNAEIEAQYAADLFKIAQDRYSIIKDVNFLCGPNGDIRFQRANALIAEDATKGGFSIIVNGSNADLRRKAKQGKLARLDIGADKAQKILDDFLERTQLHILCIEHAKVLLRDGDLFLNVIVDTKNGKVLRIKRAPVLTMKKNINEYGEFINPEKAFSQIEANEIYKISQNIIPVSRNDFAIYQINHIRWLPDETQIYGVSQYSVSRKCYHMLEEMEKALAYRRMYRSVSKRSHRIDRGTKADIEQYKRDNAMVDLYGEPTKNAHMLTDYIGNVEVTALHDEANLDEIKDIELIENTLWINLLVPKAIITGGQGINRDVLKVQYPHYLQSLETITDRLEYGDNSIYSGYRAIIDLQLMLAGINPENISYDIVWSAKTYDTTIDRVESIQNALGKGGGKQLISHEKAIQLLSQDFDIEDPAVMYNKILEENGYKTENASKKIVNDELEETKNKFATKTVESFKYKWSSFFNSIYLDILNESNYDFNSAMDTVKKAINNKIPYFYMEFVTEAGIKGSKRALKNIEIYKNNKNLIHDDVNNTNDDFNIGIDDIYNDLLNFSGQRIKSINDVTLKKIRDELSSGLDAGEGWKNLIKRLKPIIVDEQRAEAIAKTELSWAYNRSIKRVYSKAGFDGLQWISSKGLGVCDYCRSMDGKVFSADEHPDNPAHPNCECTWAPAMLNEK